MLGGRVGVRPIRPRVLSFFPLEPVENRGEIFGGFTSSPTHPEARQLGSEGLAVARHAERRQRLARGQIDQGVQASRAVRQKSRLGAAVEPAGTGKQASSVPSSRWTRNRPRAPGKGEGESGPGADLEVGIRRPDPHLPDGRPLHCLSSPCARSPARFSRKTRSCASWSFTPAPSTPPSPAPPREPRARSG